MCNILTPLPPLHKNFKTKPKTKNRIKLLVTYVCKNWSGALKNPLGKKIPSGWFIKKVWRPSGIDPMVQHFDVFEIWSREPSIMFWSKSYPADEVRLLVYFLEDWNAVDTIFQFAARQNGVPYVNILVQREFPSSLEMKGLICEEWNAGKILVILGSFNL